MERQAFQQYTCMLPVLSFGTVLLYSMSSFMYMNRKTKWAHVHSHTSLPYTAIQTQTLPAHSEYFPTLKWVEDLK